MSIFNFYLIMFYSYKDIPYTHGPRSKEDLYFFSKNPRFLGAFRKKLFSYYAEIPFLFNIAAIFTILFLYKTQGISSLTPLSFLTNILVWPYSDYKPSIILDLFTCQLLQLTTFLFSAINFSTVYFSFFYLYITGHSYLVLPMEHYFIQQDLLFLLLSTQRLTINNVGFFALPFSNSVIYFITVFTSSLVFIHLHRFYIKKIFLRLYFIYFSIYLELSEIFNHYFSVMYQPLYRPLNFFRFIASSLFLTVRKSSNSFLSSHLVSPHVSIYNLEPMALISITFRITGVALIIFLISLLFLPTSAFLSIGSFKEDLIASYLYLDNLPIYSSLGNYFDFISISLKSHLFYIDFSYGMSIIEESFLFLDNLPVYMYSFALILYEFYLKTYTYFFLNFFLVTPYTNLSFTFDTIYLLLFYILISFILYHCIHSVAHFLLDNALAVEYVRRTGYIYYLVEFFVFLMITLPAVSHSFYRHYHNTFWELSFNIPNLQNYFENELSIIRGYRNNHFAIHTSKDFVVSHDLLPLFLDAIVVFLFFFVISFGFFGRGMLFEDPFGDEDSWKENSYITAPHEFE